MCKKGRSKGQECSRRYSNVCEPVFKRYPFILNSALSIFRIFSLFKGQSINERFSYPNSATLQRILT